MILIFIFCTLPCLMAATTRSQVADLKQQVDAGIARHLAMSRELPNWLDEYETKKFDLEDVMNATTICTRRAWIREKIRVLEELYEKIKFTWDLKGEQLDTLSEVLHHENYTNTALKGFSPDDENNKECEELLKSLDHYIKLANETHVEEGNLTEINKQTLDDQLEWWRTQACDCIWTEWGSWSECTKTCGEGENAGTTRRFRTVSQEALNNGTCSGSPDHIETCNERCCPVDCTWTTWTDWTKCEEKCPVGPDDGKIHRYRTKNEHQCGGTPCNGTSSECKDCDIVDILRDKIDTCDEENDDLKSELQACTDKDCNKIEEAEIATFDRGQLVKKIEKWGPEYRIEFHIKMKSSTSMPPNIEHNLFNLAADGCESSWGYKCRIPFVSIDNNGDSLNFHTSISQIPSEYEYYYDEIDDKNFDVEMNLDQWYNVVMDHTIDTDGIGKFTLYVDCKNVWEVSGTAATAYNNVAIYQSETKTPSAGPYVDVRGLRFLNYA